MDKDDDKIFDKEKGDLLPGSKQSHPHGDKSADHDGKEDSKKGDFD
jgi:hypothetical protein